MPEQIDGIDAKILHLIQSNAALSVADLVCHPLPVGGALNAWKKLASLNSA